MNELKDVGSNKLLAKEKIQVNIHIQLICVMDMIAILLFCCINFHHSILPDTLFRLSHRSFGHWKAEDRRNYGAQAIHHWKVEGVCNFKVSQIYYVNLIMKSAAHITFHVLIGNLHIKLETSKPMKRAWILWTGRSKQLSRRLQKSTRMILKTWRW